jgi:hypothetical protein
MDGGSGNRPQLEGGQKELSDLPDFQLRAISTPTNLAEDGSQNVRFVFLDKKLCIYRAHPQRAGPEISFETALSLRLSQRSTSELRASSQQSCTSPPLEARYSWRETERSKQENKLKLRLLRQK